MLKRMICMALALSLLLPLLPPATHAEEVWVCGKEAHSHAAACRDQGFACGKEADGEHTHGDGCYEIQQNQVCELPEAHEHGEACYEEEKLVCQIPETHAHVEACLEDQQILTCEIHVHDENCMGEVLTCELEEHTHTDVCKCTCETLCTADSVKADCGICGGENANLTKCQGAALELCSHEEVKDSCAICEVEAAIAALPTAEEWLDKTDADQRLKDYNTAQDVTDQYNTLTEDQQGKVSNFDKLEKLHEAFNKQTQPTEITGTCGDNLTWTLDENGTLTISGEGTLTEFHVDGAVNAVVIESGVTSIGEYAFRAWGMTNISIPNSVTRIEKAAFLACDNLTSVVLPSGITEISEYMFKFCDNLSSIVIPDSVTVIGQHAFEECGNLCYISLPQNLTTIGNSAFYRSGLREITFPATVSEIGYSAFDESSLLVDITFLGSAPTFGGAPFYFAGGSYGSYVINVHYPANDESWTTFIANETPPATLGAHVTWIKDGVDNTELTGTCGANVTWVLHEDGTLEISGIGDMDDFHRAYSTNIPWNAHLNKIKKVVVNDGVTSIGGSAFRNCFNITSITLPAGIKTIGGWAFCDCASLNEIIFTGNAPDFDGLAFYGATLTVYYPQQDDTWETEGVKDNYGGNITWLPSGTACTQHNYQKELIDTIYEYVSDTHHKGTEIYQEVCQNVGCGEIKPMSHTFVELQEEEHTMVGSNCSLCGFGPISVSFTLKETALHAGDDIKIEAKVVGGTGNYTTYYWSVTKADGTVVHPASTPVSVPQFSWKANEGGSYIVTLRVVDDKNAEKTASSDSIAVTAHDMLPKSSSVPSPNTYATDKHHYLTVTTYDECSVCQMKENEDSKEVTEEHRFSTSKGYEAAHPHEEYYRCQGCNYAKYTNTQFTVNGTVQDASQCCVCKGHSWGSVQFRSAHPHKGYKECIRCSSELVVNQTGKVDSCDQCVPGTVTDYIDESIVEKKLDYLVEEQVSEIEGYGAWLKELGKGNGQFILNEITVEDGKVVLIIRGKDGKTIKVTADETGMSPVTAGFRVLGLEKYYTLNNTFFEKYNLDWEQDIELNLDANLYIDGAVEMPNCIISTTDNIYVQNSDDKNAHRIGRFAVENCKELIVQDNIQINVKLLPQKGKNVESEEEKMTILVDDDARLGIINALDETTTPSSYKPVSFHQLKVVGNASVKLFGEKIEMTAVTLDGKAKLEGDFSAENLYLRHKSEIVDSRITVNRNVTLDYKAKLDGNLTAQKVTLNSNSQISGYVSAKAVYYQSSEDVCHAAIHTDFIEITKDLTFDPVTDKNGTILETAGLYLPADPNALVGGKHLSSINYVYYGSNELCNIKYSQTLTPNDKNQLGKDIIAFQEAQKDPGQKTLETLSGHQFNYINQGRPEEYKLSKNQDLTGQISQHIIAGYLEEMYGYESDSGSEGIPVFTDGIMTFSGSFAIDPRYPATGRNLQSYECSVNIIGDGFGRNNIGTTKITINGQTYTLTFATNSFTTEIEQTYNDYKKVAAKEIIAVLTDDIKESAGILLLESFGIEMPEETDGEKYEKMVDELKDYLTIEEDENGKLKIATKDVFEFIELAQNILEIIKKFK